MDVASAKLIGAGLAAMGAGFAAIGVGLIFGMFLQGALRNPAAADKLGRCNVHCKSFLRNSLWVISGGSRRR